MNILRDRIARMGLFDLIFSSIALLIHLLAVVYLVFIVSKRDYVYIFDGGYVEILFWVIITLLTPLRFVLVISAARLLQSADLVEMDPETVLKRFNFWRTLNIVMIVIYCLTLSQIYGIVYNCCLVCFSSSIRDELHDLVSSNERVGINGTKKPNYI